MQLVCKSRNRRDAGSLRKDVAVIWKRLRRPFVLPESLHAVSCSARNSSWESIDIDMAGCTLCGAIHDCQAESECRLEIDESNMVCTITGFCVRERVYAETEFADTVGTEASGSVQSPVANFVEYEAVYMHIHKILCSQDARMCLEQENMRVAQKLQYTCYRMLKEMKLQSQRTGVLPTLCAIEQKLAVLTRNIRICPLFFDEEERKALAMSACKAITRLICSLHKVCPGMFRLLRTDMLTVGLLYLMRSGLILHNTTVLPCIPALGRLLPLESYLYPCFQIKCKTITEVENLVKINLRGIDASRLHRLGIDSIDEVVRH